MAAATDADERGPAADVVLHRHPAALVRRVGTTISLLHPASDDPPITIADGTTVWDAFSAPRTVNAAVDRIVPADTADAETARRVVRSVIDTLLSARLLTPDEPGSTER